ncbi:hypothetical protein EUTSA_v10026839mg, partial [Eutrema salsugineum]
LNTIVVVSLLNVLFPIAAIAATRSAFKDEKTRSQSMGFICAGLNIVMYGSPLSAMKTVVTTKSVKYMPFWLSFFLFLNGAIWGVYASLQHDIFLLVSNVLLWFTYWSFYGSTSTHIEDKTGILEN